MNHHRVFAVLFASLLVAQPVAAAETDDLFAEDDSDSLVPAWVQTAVSYVLGQAEAVFADDGPADASAAAQRFQDEINDHSGTYQSYINDRVDATEDRNVIEVTFVGQDEEVTVYVVADVTDGEYQNLSVVDSTNNTIDESHTLCGDAARDAADVLADLRTEYIEDNQTVPRSEAAHIYGRYEEGINSCQ